MLKKELAIELEETVAKISRAQAELNRPSEDSVTFSICGISKDSIRSLIKLYLKDKEIVFNENNSIAELLHLAIQIDPSFAHLDLSGVACNQIPNNQCNGRYCLSTAQVNRCLETVDEVKKMVLKKIS